MGVFAIAGIPPLAGFFSKDEILYQTFASPNPLGKLLWLVGLLTAGLTSFYMFRLWFKTFFGPERFDHTSPMASEHRRLVPRDLRQAPVHSRQHRRHPWKPSTTTGQAAHPHGVHESPWIMTGPPRHPRHPLRHRRLGRRPRSPRRPQRNRALPRPRLRLHRIAPTEPPPSTPAATASSSASPPSPSSRRPRRPRRRLPLLLPQPRHRRRPRRTLPQPSTRLVDHKFYIDELYDTTHRHPPPRLHPPRPRPPRRSRPRQSGGSGNRSRRHPRPRQTSPAACSPETSAPTPAGSPSEPPPSSPS